jgi:hypothetical protein
MATKNTVKKFKEFTKAKKPERDLRNVPADKMTKKEVRRYWYPSRNDPRYD